MRKRFIRCLALLWLMLFSFHILPVISDEKPANYITLEPVPLLSTTELEFGRVALRSLKSASFDIANQGADTLVITSIKSRLGFFDVSIDSSITLAQDSLLTVQVHFSPDEAMKVEDQLLISTNAGEMTIALYAVAYELWPLAWRLEADSSAWFGSEDGLCSMTYNPITHHLLALNKNNGGTIYIIDPDHGRLLGRLNTPANEPYQSIAAAADGQLFLATLAPAGTAFKLYRYANERAVPNLVFAGTLSGRTGDALAVSGIGSGQVVYVSGIDNPKIFAFATLDGQQYRRGSDIILPETGAAGFSISATASGDYLFVKGPGKSSRYIRISGEQVHKFESAQSPGTCVHYFEIADESWTVRAFLAAANGFTPGSTVLELLGQPGDGLCESFKALPASTPIYAGHANPNATANVLYIGLSNLLLEMTTNNGLAAYRLSQVVPHPFIAGGILIGRVKDAVTLQPLVNSEVSLLSTELITTTDDSGTFAFTDVPAGMVTVQVSAYNYFNSSQSVVIPPGGVVTVDFLLKERRYLPIAVTSFPQGPSAVIQWDIQRPKADLSHSNKKPTSGWFQKFGRAYGAVFDLSSYANATLEQIDFNHYAWQVLHGPYRYRVHVLNWRDSTEVATIDAMTTHDSYAAPRWEMAIDLGGLAWMPQVGIFIEPLSGSADDAHPALSTNDNVPVRPGTNFIIENIDDPFRSAMDARVKNAGMGNFLLDLWINPLGERMAVSRLLQKLQPSASGALSPGMPGETRGLIKSADLVESAEPARPLTLAGFNIYRVNADHPLHKDKLAFVNDHERTFVDESAPADSGYAYAVSAVYDSTETSLVLCSHQQPLDLAIASARQDDNKNFIPDLVSRFISIRGVVSTPNLNPEFGSVHFIQDGQAGIQIRASHNFELEPGDEVFAFGILKTDKGLCVLEVVHGKGIQLLNTGSALVEHGITAAALGENMEGVLVRLDGFRIVDPVEWPAAGVDGWVRISNGPDTVIVRIDRDLDMDGMPMPGGFFNISGIVGQHSESSPANDGYDLWPRALTDFRITVSVAAQTAAPLRFELGQNYPNPFNPETTIGYCVPVTGHVSLKIYDISGKEVRVLVNRVQDAGTYTTGFDAGALPSGFYFCVLSSPFGRAARKMVFAK